MAKTLFEKLDAMVRGYQEPEYVEPPKPTFESVQAFVIDRCRFRAESGCRSYGCSMSTNPLGGSTLGTTDDADEDERIMECVAAWLRKEGVMATVRRSDVPERTNIYDDVEEGYTNIYLSIEWPSVPRPGPLDGPDEPR